MSAKVSSEAGLSDSVESKVSGLHSSEVEEQASEKSSRDGKPVELFRSRQGQKVLTLAYFVLVMTAFVENFANDSTSGLSSYATSEFNAHSLIATAAVVYKITAIVTYPIMGKLHDLAGRSQGFGFAVLLYTLAYVLYASCQNADTYVCAEIFFAVGKVGYRVFQQAFIAENSSLINRGFLSQLPDAIAGVPSLYVGSVIQDAYMAHTGWRWGYGSFAIIMFVACILLTAFMYYVDTKTKQDGNHRMIDAFKDLPEGPWYKKTAYFLFVKLDLFGGALMLVGMCLVFVPLTLTGTKSSYKWHEAKLIAMVVVGFVIFVTFLLYNAKVPKHPFLPKGTMTSTMIIACLIASCDWCCNSAYATYMKTVLQVGKYVSVGEATRIDDSKKACLQIFNVVGGVLMKYTKRSKIFIITSIPIYFMGQVLAVCFINYHGGVADRGLLYMFEVFIGASRGIYTTALQVIIQGVAGEQGIAMSTAFFLAFSSAGSLIGSAISGGIWNSVVLQKLDKYLPEAEKANATKIYKSLPVALKYKKGTPERDAISLAYRETQQIIGWVTLGILVPMLVLMWFVKNIKLTDHVDIYQTDSELESTLDEKVQPIEVVATSEEIPRSRKQKFYDLIGI
ncbi:hypothetical protein PSN45_002366 [Yamadazyma tenuis]|uniref:MFS general substrate transporter n=1 Tax=Candida tenuis (strain ATCC 10573 / BCRC 21748 / CBS 615 / JCM 9827 / NBRC 10315 / NRRL Y-1498 / VKM Y-70) TaxID=590646 RepID=G3B0R3_CANTC|nr:MFS general substrate transporter [Yamadazyma tenuis ATCC 10573]EGV65455.1 MFS general substrate transporter [Yamadazyma tenuis ATCC 10573]WEJ94866.1 hypothetical protein PSN45_002366 [Yamadazyma tenuis]